MSLKPKLMEIDINNPEHLDSLQKALEKRNKNTDKNFLVLMDEFEKIKKEMDHDNPNHRLAYLGMYNAKSLCKDVACETVNRTIELLLEQYHPSELLGITPFAVMEKFSKALEFSMGSALNEMNGKDFEEIA